MYSWWHVGVDLVGRDAGAHHLAGERAGSRRPTGPAWRIRSMISGDLIARLVPRDRLAGLGVRRAGDVSRDLTHRRDVTRAARDPRSSCGSACTCGRCRTSTARSPAAAWWVGWPAACARPQDTGFPFSGSRSTHGGHGDVPIGQRLQATRCHPGAGYCHAPRRPWEPCRAGDRGGARRPSAAWGRTSAPQGDPPRGRRRLGSDGPPSRRPRRAGRRRTAAVLACTVVTVWWAAGDRTHRRRRRRPPRAHRRGPGRRRRAPPARTASWRRPSSRSS